MDNKRIARELVKIAKEISAASEIGYDELPEDRKALVKKIFGNKKPMSIWEGIHGYIVDMRGINLIKGRSDKNDLKESIKLLDTLVKDKNFRWIENIDGKISIGF